MATKFELHKQRWLDCQECDLCSTRKHVVLLKGSIPSKVLFLGEAPGESEDVLGQPFVGPAGKLLDTIISEATDIPPNKFAYSNLICCIPRDEVGIKTTSPPKYAIEACSDRLRECVQLVQPKLVVWVGDEAKKYGPKILAKHSPAFKTVHIVHPGAIIRMPVASQGLAIKRSIVTLRTALEGIKC
jgi:uracil-DNA glycosylase